MWRIPSTDLFELNSGHLILLLKSIAKSCEFQGEKIMLTGCT